MHGNRFISALLKLSLAAMVLSTVSCSKVVEPESNEQDSRPDINATSEVTVEFNILDPDSLPATKVDTPNNWGGYDNTASEKVVNNLWLFAVDYDKESGTETVEEAVKIDLVPGDFTATGIRTGHTFELSSGIKRFYVGANMTEEHVNAFRNKTPMRADSYESALAMVMDNYDTKTGEGTNILMFSAPAKDNSTSETDIDITSTRFLSITAQLKRLVSKVMVVGNYKGTKTDATGRVGEDIYYLETDNGFFFDFQVILNNTNRALTIAETFSDGSDLFNIDPNWNLSTMVLKDGDGLVRYKDMFDMDGNFTTWDGDQLKERLESTSDWWCSDVPPKTSEYMGKGFYCLENTVFDDYSKTSSLTVNEKTQAAYLATTHVYIKARFAPKTVTGWSDDTVKPGTQSISDMQTVREAENGSYPYTFFINKNNGKFYTWKGIERWIEAGKATASDFTEYTGGWVYFRTFFEEGGKDDLDNQITYDGIEYWGIRRNDYCILTINSIENWGGTSPGEAFIKVKSETVPWVKAGKSDITVTPE
ncbi:MAG: Mfa1 family fimbria major subunit [Bacteroidales bacterium]|nr:Mfa1 family fimbria major subunit [Bacteroidales bacterium]